MNTIWESVTWNVARAGGFTSYILLTLAVLVGLALSTQLQSPSRWPRLINSELHNFLTLLGTIFLGVHVLAVIVDPYTHFGLNEVLIPLASHYRAEWMALGIVALYLGIAIGISTLLRKHIGYKWWRRLHVLTLGIFALATIHGLGTGSDTQTPWALGLYLVSTTLVGALLCKRIFFSKPKNKHVPARTAVPVPARPAPPVQARSMNAVPQNNPRIPNGAGRMIPTATQPQRTGAAHTRTNADEKCGSCFRAETGAAFFVCVCSSINPTTAKPHPGAIVWSRCQTAR